jgi:hypothetical protein
MSGYEYVVLGLIAVCVIAMWRGWRQTDSGMRNPDEAQAQRRRALEDDLSGGPRA